MIKPKNKPGWVVYPPPPKPSYNSDTKTVVPVTNKPDAEVFDFTKCEIPGEDPDWEFTSTMTTRTWYTDQVRRMS